MKSDFIKLFLFLWLSVVVYFLYDIWANTTWIASAVNAYLQMMMEHIRH
jgi:hypothetical protein